jgi:hypothetical protein
MGDDGPADPISPIHQGVVSMHEIYLALREGGFTRLDSIAIITGLLHKMIESENDA